MAKDKEKDVKTNAMRILDTLGVPYEVITYTCDEFTDGVHLAEQLGQPAEQTFKTLVAEGKSGGYFAFVIPVAEELDLKAAARAVGEKAVELIHVKDLQKVTGYIRGGCTAIGMKKDYPTVIDETVVLLSKGEVDSKKIRVEFSLEDMDMSEFQDGATYPQIKEYVLEHTGLKVSNLYISQIKRKCGIGVGKNYNLPKSEDSRQPQCPPEKEKAIREAFKYFGMI